MNKKNYLHRLDILQIIQKTCLKNQKNFSLIDCIDFICFNKYELIVILNPTKMDIIKPKRKLSGINKKEKLLLIPTINIGTYPRELQQIIRLYFG